MSINIGNGQTVADQWIPVGVDTGVCDMDGQPLHTADKVKLTGCSAKWAIIGRAMNGKFVLYFGTERNAVGWNLAPEVIARHKVRLMKEGKA